MRKEIKPKELRIFKVMTPEKVIKLLEISPERWVRKMEL